MKYTLLKKRIPNRYKCEDNLVQTATFTVIFNKEEMELLKEYPDLTILGMIGNETKNYIIETIEAEQGTYKAKEIFDLLREYKSAESNARLYTFKQKHIEKLEKYPILDIYKIKDFNFDNLSKYRHNYILKQNEGKRMSMLDEYKRRRIILPQKNQTTISKV